MEKIGILTLNRANNYGAVLQNFALCKAINELEYGVETIDYYIDNIEEEYKVEAIHKSIDIKRAIKHTFWNITNLRKATIRKNKFDDFRNEYIKTSKTLYTKDTINSTCYSLYIVGSDQVWNRDIVGESNEQVFDLSFTNNKRASYAGSCGSINTCIKLDELKNYDVVTVRENELKKLLEENNIQSKIVCDPTLLLKREYWENLVDFQKKFLYKYVYLYYIDSGRDEAAKIAKYISKIRGEKVVHSQRYDKKSVLKKYGKSMYSDGPLDFLNRIYFADFIVVSSFHGVIFSLLFEKEFVALLHDKTGNRVKSLLSELDLSNRIVTSLEDFKTREINFLPIDYSSINVKLEVIRENSICELANICELIK